MGGVKSCARTHCLAHVYYYERAPAHVCETCVYKGVVTLYHFTAKLPANELLWALGGLVGEE